MRSIDIQTPSGACRTQFFTPSTGTGPWPAAILCTDAGGPRPAFDQLAQQLADQGFVAVVPNLFFRDGHPMDVLPEGERNFVHFVKHLRGTPGFREALGAKMQKAISERSVKETIGAILEALEHAPEVRDGAVGISGYCMGGTVVLRAASQFPEHIRAGASFHGGNLATLDPNSPHLGAKSIEAEILIAGAVEDASFSDEIAQRLAEAFKAAGTNAHIETWPGALHGFAVPDSDAFTPAFGARHLTELTALYRRTLTR